MAIFYVSREINLFLEILLSHEHSKMLVSGNLKLDSFKLRDMRIKSHISSQDCQLTFEQCCTDVVHFNKS